MAVSKWNFVTHQNIVFCLGSMIFDICLSTGLIGTFCRFDLASLSMVAAQETPSPCLLCQNSIPYASYHCLIHGINALLRFGGALVRYIRSGGLLQENALKIHNINGCSPESGFTVLVSLKSHLIHIKVILDAWHNRSFDI